MKFAEAKKIVHKAVEKKVPTMLWGPPGVGKSSLVREVVSDYRKEKGDDFGYIDLRLPQLEPTDLRGIPAPNRETGKAEWFRPAFLPDSGEGILFLDEIEKAVVSVKNASLQLVLDRRVGDYHLPPGWAVLAAGNREEDGCFSAPLGSALCNRLIHIDVDADLDTWFTWARANGICDEIIGYLGFRTDHIYLNTQENAFPSPRSWEVLNKMLIDVDNKEEQNRVLQATVGKVVGVEFRTWLAIYKDVNVEDIINKGIIPDFEKRAKEASFKYAVTAAVAHYVKKRKTFTGIEQNTAKFVKQLQPEMRIVFCKQIPMNHLAKMCEHPAFKEIAEDLMRIVFGV